MGKPKQEKRLSRDDLFCATFCSHAHWLVITDWTSPYQSLLQPSSEFWFWTSVYALLQYWWSVFA